jgi:hypothetical protein
MGTLPALQVTAAQAVAYRASVHHLGRRLPPGRLVAAATPCPLQDSVPAGAALALAARVEGLVPAELERELFVDRSLVRLPSLRGVPHVVARHGGVAFGPGALAIDEASLRDQLLGDWLDIDAAGWTARDALAAVAGVVVATLAGDEPCTADDLRAALHGNVPPELEPWCARCGAHHVPHRLLRLAGTAGAFCYGRQVGGDHLLVTLDRWLGGPLGEPGPGRVEAARTDLARRFLHAYAPAVPERLAAWAGIGIEDARRRFARLVSEVVEVDVDGRPGWALAGDVDALQDPPPVTGVRLLPPDDPFLHQRDRATLLPDADARQRVWDVDVRPGVVLVDGRPVATWRARIVGRRLEVTVEMLPGGGRLGPRVELELEDEALGAAPFLGCGDAVVSVVG